MNIPNMVYRRVLIKLHNAKKKWFAIHVGQAGGPPEDEVIKLSGVWPWLAKRTLRIQEEKILTYDLDH